jgi:hypothetical protein
MPAARQAAPPAPARLGRPRRRGRPHGVASARDFAPILPARPPTLRPLPPGTRLFLPPTPLFSRCSRSPRPAPPSAPTHPSRPGREPRSTLVPMPFAVHCLLGLPTPTQPHLDLTHPALAAPGGARSGPAARAAAGCAGTGAARARAPAARPRRGPGAAATGATAGGLARAAPPPPRPRPHVQSAPAWGRSNDVQRLPANTPPRRAPAGSGSGAAGLPRRGGGAGVAHSASLPPGPLLRLHSNHIRASTPQSARGCRTTAIGRPRGPRMRQWAPLRRAGATSRCVAIVKARRAAGAASR